MAPVTYGNNKDWWKGSEILQPEVQEAQAAGAEYNWELKRVQWVAELHRLSAFLDSTERAYGTADLLAGARGRSRRPGEGVLRKPSRRGGELRGIGDYEPADLRREDSPLDGECRG